MASYVGRRIGYGIGGFFLILIAVVFILSFFLDGIIRPRIERAMNEKLKGYHTNLPYAHLQLLGGRLTLSGLNIIQEKDPTPPVAHIDKMQFTIQWSQLFSGHIVADVLLDHPKVHIDTRQFEAEKSNKVAVQQEGWQEALANVYPFKINRFHISDGDITYISANDPQRPLRVEHLNFTADNIRNIHYASNQYPSPIHASAVIFGEGKFDIHGKANFLEAPFPGVQITYKVSDLPLKEVTPASVNVNLEIHGGVLTSRGVLEYSPEIARMEVDDGTLDGVAVTYLNTPATKPRAKQQVDEAGQTAEKENNRSQVVIMVKHFAVRDSKFAYDDKDNNPNYELTFADTQLELTNYSNHEAQGPAHVTIHCKFMGSGDTTVDGTFLAEQQGPAFNMNLAIKNTDLTAMNNLLVAYGRFNVERGDLSVYAQVGVKNGDVTGYVKPLFSDLKVYEFAKEKHQPVLRQVYEATIGAASHLFKNHRTEKVATQVDLGGRLKNPNVSTWQAIVEVVHNAFVKAILPGFDRQTQLARNQAK